MENEQYFRKLVDEICKEKQLGEDYLLSISRDASSGNGYFGDIIKAKISGKNDSLSLVVKVSIKNDKVRAVVPVDEAYNNESIFYKDIFPAMKKLQEQLRMQNLFDSVPKFLGCAEYGDHSYLAMEDLTESGFGMFNLREEVDHEHLVMICELFGRFHALSFAFKHLKPELYMDFVNRLQCVHSGFLRYKGGFLKHCVSVIKEGLDKCGSNNKMINFYVENIETSFKNILSDSKKDKYSCIIHYDGWLNNLMFKYRDSIGSRTLTDIKLFDWQTCNVGSPAIDLSIVLYAIASKTILDNLNEYLEIYHNAFKEFLSQTGLRTEDVYPFEVLKYQWKTYCEYGMIRGFLVHKLRMNVVNTGGSFEDAINADFNVEEMGQLMDNLLKHLENIGVF